MNLKPNQLKQIVKKLLEQASRPTTPPSRPSRGPRPRPVPRSNKPRPTRPMSRKGGGTIGRHPSKGVPQTPVSQVSGCLDPVSNNFCENCSNDCNGNPATGVQTGLFGWNWSSNNDDLGDTSCCQY
tara:strand:- start:326 stop:703 length:378 start_codon:yes stop_codon:yes gene_type:complete